MTAVLRIEKVLGPVCVQDAGRPGHMHDGVPPGGALVRSLRLRAIHAVHGSSHDAVLECFAALDVRALGGARVLSDGDSVWSLAEGETVRIPAPTPRRVRYVAIRGGLCVAVQRGGRGSLASGGLGPFEGRWLRNGDTLPVGEARDPHAPPPELPVPEPSAPVRILPGPDLDAFRATALDHLASQHFVVDPASDRVGVRLRAPVAVPVPLRSAQRTAPMVRGAIEITGDGSAIVLGPDHPVTGGYPLLAVVAASSMDDLFVRPPGSTVRFSLR